MSSVARNCSGLYPQTAFPLTTLIRLYELLKNDSQLSKADAIRLELNAQSALHQLTIRAEGWWRMTGSNRRPPACKAGALPAELIPQEFGGPGWIRTNDPRLIKTVL